MRRLERTQLWPGVRRAPGLETGAPPLCSQGRDRLETGVSLLGVRVYAWLTDRRTPAQEVDMLRNHGHKRGVGLQTMVSHLCWGARDVTP